MNLGAMGDVAKLLGQAGKIRENLAKVPERAARRTVAGEAGGGLIKVTANGIGEVLSVAIDPEALKDPETLGTLVAAAMNAASRKVKEVMQEETREALGGIDLPPGLLGL